MVSELKYFILFLFISLIPSESVCISEGNSAYCRRQNVIDSEECGILSCISDKMNALVAYIASGTKAHISGNEDNKSYSFKKNDESPTPFFIDLVVRATDWFSDIKIAQNRLSGFKDQKNTYQGETLSYQCKSDNIYIPPLKYYIYTLKRIIT